MAQEIKLKVRGARDHWPEEPAIGGIASWAFTATVKETVRLDSSRGDQSPVEFLNVVDDDAPGRQPRAALPG